MLKEKPNLCLELFDGCFKGNKFDATQYVQELSSMVKQALDNPPAKQKLKDTEDLLIEIS